MRGAHDPTPEQIRAWAATPAAVEPVQDWHLVISWLPYEQLYLELAADDGCPNRRYFLALLYLMVGDAVRTQFRARPEHAVLYLLECGRAFSHPDLDAWLRRSRQLLRRPETFDYDAWCAGGLAADGG